MADLLANDGPKGGEQNNEGKKPDLLRKWQGYLKISIEDKSKKEAEIKRGKAMYYRPDSGTEGAMAAQPSENLIMKAPPNHAKNGIDIIVDQVYERNPKVSAKAKAPVFIQIPDPMTGMVTQMDVSEERTNIIEGVLNHEMDQSSLKQECKAAIRSAHIAPEAWMQVGYQFDDDNKIDAIFFRYRSVKDIFADPKMQIYEGIIRKCRFIALRIQMTSDEAEAMGLSAEILRKAGDCITLDSETELYNVYFMWDMTTMLQGFITENGSEFPKPPAKWPWQIDGFPFEVLRFSENPDERWSRAPIIDVEGLQVELDDQRETMNRHVVNARPVKLYDESLDETTVNALAGRDKGQWHKVKGLVERPERIKIWNDDPLNNEFYGHYERNKMEMAEIMKYRPADLLQTTGVTATESQDVAKKAANQIGSKIDVVEDFLRRIIRKAKQIIEQTYTTDRMSEISGKDGKKFWVRWNGGMLQDTDVDLEVGSTERETGERKAQVALNMLGTMLKVPGMNIIELALDVLRRSDYRDVEKYKQAPAMPAPMPGQPGGVATQPGVSPAGIDGQTNPMQ